MAIRKVVADDTPEELAPYRDMWVEGKLNTYKVKYVLKGPQPIEEWDLEKSLHNQARMGHPLDESTVLRYKEAMRQGNVFPAVTAIRKRSGDRRRVNADGNHRTQAAKELGIPLAVYEVDPETPPATITRLTYEFNTRHGLPTSEADRVQQALHLIESGVSARDAAQALVLPLTKVENERRKRAANQRIIDLGVSVRDWEAIHQSTRGVLGSVTTDEGLAGAIKLTRAADLSVDEVRELVGDLNRTRSSAKQLEILRAYEEVYEERIRSGGGSTKKTRGKKQDTPRAVLARGIGILKTLSDPLSAAKSYPGAEREAARKNVDEVIKKLQEVRRALSA